MPVQESGNRPHRPSQVMPQADVTVNRSANTVTATMSNAGPVGVSLFVFPDKYLTVSATPFTVVSGTSKTYTWTAVKKNGYGYAFSIYGPDGFVRSFAGAVVGVTAVTYTLTVNDYADITQAVTVGASASVNVTWPVDSHWYYDAIVTANTSDGFTRRYAGRIA
jgi:phospholipase C